MARLPRICLPGLPLHVIQRGNNRQRCFTAAQDMAVYAAWLDEYARKYQVAIHAWVLMTNHVHLLVTPHSGDGVSKMMQSLGRRYVRYFNQTYRRTGTLWEGRFRSCVVDSDGYLLVCQRYIEMNPVRAGLVGRPQDHLWSSYRANAHGLPGRLVTHHQTYLQLGATPEQRQERYRALFGTAVDAKTLTRIREASNRGLILGNDRFVAQIERMTGQRLRPMRRGPRTKPSGTSGSE